MEENKMNENPEIIGLLNIANELKRVSSLIPLLHTNIYGEFKDMEENKQYIQIQSDINRSIRTVCHIVGEIISDDIITG